MVVLYHVVQTLTSRPPRPIPGDYFINVSVASADPVHIILELIRHIGRLGNAIFLICSAWFLLDKETSAKKKALGMLADIWVMSMCVFVPVIIVRKGDVSTDYIIKSLFPTIYMNNWYMTCYILLCLLYPFLNRLIKTMSQRELLGAALFLGIVYIVINYRISTFFSSHIIVWISVYFILAYIKKYGAGIENSTKFAVALLLAGVIGNTLVVLGINFAGLKFTSYSESPIFGDKGSNPFIFMIALGAFCLFNKAKFHSKFINGVSSLSMLIYILHENLLLRKYYRTLLWHEIYVRFGHDHILAWALTMAACLFVASAIICFVYSKTIQKLTHVVSDKLYVALQKFYRLIEKKVFKIDSPAIS